MDTETISMKRLPIALCLCVAVFKPASGQTRIFLDHARPTNTLSRAVPSVDGTSRADGSAPSVIAGPTLGFVFDRQTAAVRRVPGISGAAKVGDALRIRIPLAAAYTAPQQDYVVGISATDGTVTLLLLSHGAASGTSPLTWVPPAPDRIAFSPSGDSLALFYARDEKLIALTGIPQAPQIASSWDLSLYRGSLTSLAIKDGGDSLLGGITQDSGGVLVLFPAGGTANVVLPMSRPAAAQFLWGSRDAIVADQSAGMVYLLKSVDGDFQELALTQAEDGLAAPDLLAVDRSGRVALVAHSGGSSGLAIDLTNATAQPFQCQCVISVLEPLNGDVTYRITDFRAGQFVAIDASASPPRFQAIGTPPSHSGEACPVGGRTTPRTGLSAPEFAGPDFCRAPGNREQPQ